MSDGLLKMNSMLVGGGEQKRDGGEYQAFSNKIFIYYFLFFLGSI